MVLTYIPIFPHIISNILTRGSDQMVLHKGKWSEEEDQLLADKVIQYAVKGKSQLEAFKDVAEEIKRTSAACGYRWNAKLRDNFQKDLQQAKKERHPESPSNNAANQKQEVPENTLQSALQFLKWLDDHSIHSLQDVRELGELKKENKQLREKLAYFEQAYSHAFLQTK